MSLHPLDQKTSLRADDGLGIPIVPPRKLANNETQSFADEAGRLADEYTRNPLALAGDDGSTNFHVIKERPEHRLVLYMVSQGMSTKEIALNVGMTEHWVRQIKRQPWFKTRLVELLHEAGKDAVTNFLQGEVLTSVQTLVEIRDDTGVKAATRVSACNAILDRALGKPTQHIESEVKHIPAGEITEEAARLDRELASVTDQLKHSGSGAN